MSNNSNPNHHILSVLVENKAGVLARVASLFARRGFNIFSLAVAPTNNSALSRITIVVDVESNPLSQVISQLDKLINVVEITELDPKKAVQKELLLATIKAGQIERNQVIQSLSVFGAKVVDVSPTAVTVELAAEPDTLDAFEEIISDFGILDIQRTGRIALKKLR
jgi:acetolactate synthase-1/3 small subunit